MNPPSPHLPLPPLSPFNTSASSVYRSLPSPVVTLSDNALTRPISHQSLIRSGYHLGRGRRCTPDSPRPLHDNLRRRTLAWGCCRSARALASRHHTSCCTAPTRPSHSSRRQLKQKRRELERLGRVPQSPIRLIPHSETLHFGFWSSKLYEFKRRKTGAVRLVFNLAMQAFWQRIRLIFRNKLTGKFRLNPRLG